MRWRGYALALAIAAMARGEVFPIRVFTSANGLAEGRINAIVEDPRGFLWFAASGGLSRFDGYRFLTWGTGAKASYSPSFSILASPEGKFLVATDQGIRQFQSGGPERSQLMKQGGGSAASDLRRTKSGRVLAISNEKVYEVVGGNRLESLGFPKLHPGVGIGAVGEDLNGRIWVALPPDGLLIYELTPQGGVLRQRARLPKNVHNVNDILEGPSGYVWVACERGLVRYQQRNSNGDWQVTGAFGAGDGLAGREATALLRRSGGEIWAGTISGISRFQEAEAGHPRFRNITRGNGLPDGHIITLAEDSAGNVWAGTETAGAMMIKAHGFTTYQEGDGIQQLSLHQVIEDRQGEILAVGTGGSSPSGRTLTFFDGERFQQTGTSLFGSKVAPWSWQRLLIQSRTGEWWATTAKGLCRYAAVSARALRSAHPEACYTDEPVFHIFEDSRGDIWASAPGSRLFCWRRAAGEAIYLSADGAESRAPRDFGDLVEAMAEDRAGGLWFGTFHGWLYRYQDHRFERYGSAQGVPRGTIGALLSDSKGRLWMGGANGLAAILEPTAASPRFKIFDQSPMLKDASVESLVEDGFGRIWASSSRGVTAIDPATGAFRDYATEDGALPTVRPSAIRDRKGALWFATRNGLARIQPEAERPRGAPRAVEFMSIRIAGEEYLDSPLGSDRAADAVLGPGRDRVEIEFGAPGVESAASLRYQFRLEGADSDWSEPRAEAKVDYRRLESGSYRFRVRAVDGRGVPGAAAAFAFRILPPFWLRWWFELWVGIVIAGAAYWLHRYRVAQLVAVERMRADIASDLHDDIGAGLTRIAVLSEVARVHIASDATQAGTPLARIGTAAREMMDSLNDIVWSIGSPEGGIDSLIRRMREFALDVLGPAGVEFRLDCSEDLFGKHIPADTRRHLLLTFKECVHNAARHSGCGSVRAGLIRAEGNLVLMVSDDGRGMGGTDFSRGNGVRTMRRRARLMGGEIEIGPNPEMSGGTGCRVTVRIPESFRAPAHCGEL